MDVVMRRKRKKRDEIWAIGGADHPTVGDFCWWNWCVEVK